MSLPVAMTSRPFLRLEAHPAMDALPDHGLDLGALVLQREIAMPGGMRPAETRDLAAHPDMPIGVLYRPPQRGGQFGHGEFRRVDQGFGCGHLGRSNRAFRIGPQGRDFSRDRKPAVAALADGAHIHTRSEAFLRRADAVLNRGRYRAATSVWLHLMHILLLGSGGREHALAWKIAASPLVTKLWCAPGNAGIAQEAECVALDIADHAAVIEFCRTQRRGFRGGRPGNAAGGRNRRRSRRRRHQGVRAEQAGGAAGGLQGIHQGALHANLAFRPAPMAASPMPPKHWPMSARRARRSWSRPTGLRPARAWWSRRPCAKPRTPSP